MIFFFSFFCGRQWKSFVVFFFPSSFPHSVMWKPVKKKCMPKCELKTWDNLFSRHMDYFTKIRTFIYIWSGLHNHYNSSKLFLSPSFLSSSWCIMVSVLCFSVLYHCGDPALAGHLHSAAVLGNYPSVTVANATRKDETANSLWHMRCVAISPLCFKLKGGLIINYSTLCSISNSILPGHASEDDSSWRKAHVFVHWVYFEPCLTYIYCI